MIASSTEESDAIEYAAINGADRLRWNMKGNPVECRLKGVDFSLTYKKGSHRVGGIYTGTVVIEGQTYCVCVGKNNLVYTVGDMQPRSMTIGKKSFYRPGLGSVALF